MSSLTGGSALAAVVSIGQRVDAFGGAEEAVGRAHTATLLTEGATCALLAASAAVVGVVLGVDTSTGTNCGSSRRTRHNTLPSGADLTCRTSRSTSSTVPLVGLKIHTLS